MSRELSLAEVFQLGYYWETKILLTAVTLDVFTTLDGRPKSAGEVAERIGAHGPTLELLLNALVAMKLLFKQGDRYANSPVTGQYLVKSSPHYVGSLLLLHDAEWDNWGKLEEIVRTGRRMADRHVFETDPELGGNVLTVLDRIGRQSGPELARRLKLNGPVRLLDLGGGAGTNAIAFCEVYPDLTAIVFDLPATLRLTEKMVNERGLASRITLVAGDFNRDSLGGPYDVVLMSDILHYQTDEGNEALFRKVYAHLTEGGRVVVKDRFLDESGTAPAWTTAFAIHILVNTQFGSCYRCSDAMRWMKKAGFIDIVEEEKTAVVQGIKGDQVRET